MIRALAIALALVTLLAGVAAFMAYSRGTTIAALKTANRQAGTDLANAKQAATDREATIGQLTTKLDQCAGQAQAVDTATAAATAQLADAEQARDAALSALQRAREHTYATDPNAAQWGAAALPPVLSDALRVQWEHAADR